MQPVDGVKNYKAWKFAKLASGRKLKGFTSENGNIRKFNYFPPKNLTSELHRKCNGSIMASYVSHMQQQKEK